MVAQMDQVGATLEQQARIQANYFKTLVIGGLERAEALQLLLNQQEAWLYPQGDEDD